MPILSKTLLCTALAMFAFAANSVLCRLALGEQMIDAVSFTSLRLMAAVIVLFLLLSLRKSKQQTTTKGSWSAGLMLFAYASTFSLAYNTLDTGTGALILFGFVQITMIAWSFVSGQRLLGLEWLGLMMALAGMVYLMYPVIHSPSWLGFVLMAISGIAWGIYSIQGKTSQHPLIDTAYNFLRTMPWVIIMLFVGMTQMSYSGQGILLAVLSGGIASGIGYTIWYIALADLTVIQASVVQLAVPAIAALGGIIFVGEEVSLRLIVASGFILGGILMVFLGKHGLEKILNRQK